MLFRWFPYGGLQRDCLRIVQALLARGAAVRIYAMAWQGEAPGAADLQLIPARGSSRVAQRAAFAADVQARLRREPADAVLGFNKLPGLDYYYAADSCFAAKALGRRGWWYRLAPRTRQYLDFERAVFDPAGTSRILLLSGLQAEEYARWYPLPPERLLRLPPGIARDRAATTEAPRLRQALREEFGLGAEDLLLLQVGSGFAVKGVDRALRAIAALPAPLRARCHYFLVGQDKPDAYLALARRLGIAGQVRLFPGRDDIPRFLQGADLLLHPARSESAGMALLEAVVAGLPVLCTATCGYAEHVLAAQAGRVCPEPFRQRELDALLAAMLTGDERPRWRENGIRYGREQDLYSLPRHVAALLCNGEDEA